MIWIVLLFLIAIVLSIVLLARKTKGSAKKSYKYFSISLTFIGSKYLGAF